MKLITEALETSKKGTEKVAKLGECIRILPFLPPAEALVVLRACVEYIEIYIDPSANPVCQLPFDFLLRFEDVLVENFSRDTFNEVWEFLNAGISGDEISLGVCLVAAELSVDFARIRDDTEKVLGSAWLELIQSEDMRCGIVGCYFLEKFAPRYATDPDSAPSDVLGLLMPKLISTDNSVSLVAHHALCAVIHAGLLQDTECVSTLIDHFSDYGNGTESRFFEVIHVILYPVDDQEVHDYVPKMDNMVPVRDFIVDVLGHPTSPLTVAECINLVGDLMSVHPPFVSRIWPVAFREAISLIRKNEVKLFPLITPFLVAVCDKFPKKRPVIRKYIGKLSEALSDGRTLNASKTLDLAIDVGCMAKSIGVASSSGIISALGQVLIKGVKADSTLENAVRACGVILAILPIMPETLACEAFWWLNNYSAEFATVVSFLFFFVRTLRKLMVKFDLQSGRLAEMFVDRMMTGGWRHFPRIKPYGCSEMSRFLDSYMRKYPAAAGKVIDYYSHVRPNIAPMSFEKTHALRHLTTAVRLLPKVDARILQQIFDFGLASLRECELGFVVQAAAAIKLIAECWKIRGTLHLKNACVGIEAALEDTLRWVSCVDLKEQERIDQSTILEVIPSCVLLWVVVCSDGGEVDRFENDEDEMKVMLGLMPFPEEVSEQPAILEGLLKLSLIPAYEGLLEEILRIISEILDLDEKELSAFKFSSNLIKKMKWVVNKFEVGKEKK
jgi:hypothetical protein